MDHTRYQNNFLRGGGWSGKFVIINPKHFHISNSELQLENCLVSHMNKIFIIKQLSIFNANLSTASCLKLQAIKVPVSSVISSFILNCLIACFSGVSDLNKILIQLSSVSEPGEVEPSYFAGAVFFVKNGSGSGLDK